MPVAPGLLDLVSAGEMQPAIRTTQFEGLFLLARGTLPSDGAEVIRGGRMLALLGELANHFDLVIIDTPPVLAVADAVMLGAIADAVILVIRAGKTARAEAAHVLQQFAAVNAPVAGAVLNDPTGATENQGEYSYSTYEYSGVSQ
jgi:tyrosine-protein kinase Etk/Wzc